MLDQKLCDNSKASNLIDSKNDTQQVYMDSECPESTRRAQMVGNDSGTD
jgi:hypothetical protein